MFHFCGFTSKVLNMAILSMELVDSETSNYITG